MDVTFVELALPPPPAPAPPPPARSPVKSAASRARPTPVRGSAPHIARVVTNPTGPTLAAGPSSGLDIADLANASDADAGPAAAIATWRVGCRALSAVIR